MLCLFALDEMEAKELRHGLYLHLHLVIRFSQTLVGKHQLIRYKIGVRRQLSYLC